MLHAAGTARQETDEN